MVKPASLLLSLLGTAAALPAAEPEPHPQPDRVLEDRAAKVTVGLPYATVVGSGGTVETFNGIPYAKPPPASSASSPRSGSPPASAPLTPPASPPPARRHDQGLKLPVLFWIFGGGFELGSTAMYDGSTLVKAGVGMGQPFIFVAVNYRVGAFGFMPGKEILADGSSNLGLLDQRMGLEWVADNIATFGGDPSKVTIWGESAGAISVLDQMALYGGNNTYNGQKLFRGAIMNSGGIVPADTVDCPKGQAVYDQVVSAAGCKGKADTLACLRGLDYTKFLQAGNSVPGILSYHSVALAYLPRPDGVVLPMSPDILVASNQYAKVPMIIGDQEDEGTLFALFQPNLTSTAKVVSYLSDLFFPLASKAQLEGLVNTYPTSITAGSPFNTGIFNELYPGFKRLAAILGDLVFTLTRRVFLEVHTTINPKVPVWSYLASYNFGTPILGTFHGSDLLQVFYGILPNYASRSIHTYYINFVTNLDPNVGVTTYAKWPQWSEGKKLMQFWNNRANLLADNFRSSSYEYIMKNVGVLYI
ncbi:unnamed protein product [Parascedosporium putredinis]|uniref:Carboxylic ester hydrolase n=1 Tax=Parascedosporium putredinis TaxID=1442378 RepID=A0A9P1H5Z2_9PEZI|nr:unnamed protein product [Parascedosporium putredinis]CAI7999785.1 unnamed protein product [Parascedosporium putredinis]